MPGKRRFVASRRGSRQRTLQVLYAWRLTGRRSVDALDVIRRCFPNLETGDGPVSREDVAYTQRLVEGLCQAIPLLDEELAKVSTNWRLSRMTPVDLSVLRLGLYELLHAREIPGPVVVAEAVWLADRFGQERSAAFVNGLLEALRRKVRPGEGEGRG